MEKKANDILECSIRENFNAAEALCRLERAPQAVYMDCAGLPSFTRLYVGLNLFDADEVTGIIEGREIGGVYTAQVTKDRAGINKLLKKYKARGHAVRELIGGVVREKANILAFHKMDYCQEECGRWMGMKETPALNGLSRGQLIEAACKDLDYTAIWDTPEEFANALNNGFRADQYWIYVV